MPSCAQGPASGLKRARGSVRRQGTDWGCAGCARPVLREVCNMLRAAGGQAPAPKAGAARRPGPLRKLSQSQGGGAAEGASSGTWRPAPGAAGQAGLRPHPAGGSAHSRQRGRQRPAAGGGRHASAPCQAQARLEAPGRPPARPAGDAPSAARPGCGSRRPGHAIGAPLLLLPRAPPRRRLACDSLPTASQPAIATSSQSAEPPPAPPLPPSLLPPAARRLPPPCPPCLRAAEQPWLTPAARPRSGRSASSSSGCVAPRHGLALQQHGAAHAGRRAGQACRQAAE